MPYVSRHVARRLGVSEVEESRVTGPPRSLPAQPNRSARSRSNPPSVPVVRLYVVSTLLWPTVSNWVHDKVRVHAPSTVVPATTRRTYPVGG